VAYKRKPRGFYGERQVGVTAGQPKRPLRYYFHRRIGFRNIREVLRIVNCCALCCYGYGSAEQHGNGIPTLVRFGI